MKGALLDAGLIAAVVWLAFSAILAIVTRD